MNVQARLDEEFEKVRDDGKQEIVDAAVKVAVEADAALQALGQALRDAEHELSPLLGFIRLDKADAEKRVVELGKPMQRDYEERAEAALTAVRNALPVVDAYSADPVANSVRRHMERYPDGALAQADGLSENG